jgi:hypothetical protein
MLFERSTNKNRKDDDDEINKLIEKMKNNDEIKKLIKTMIKEDKSQKDGIQEDEKARQNSEE